jgi:tRNA/tmRNA/rRNA uracil-C5-methylase (TrmA/RlmC/RlmD family)
VHGPTAFLQALPELHRRSTSAAREFLAPGPGVAVLDLYCGLGATLGTWSAAGSPTLGVELSGEAVDCAARNAPAARVLRGTCLHRLPQVREWWAGVSASERVAYLNPPRSGLEADVARVLYGELRPARFAYLSCSAGTLARDLALAEASGYRVSALYPYDFFPNTHHVEVLALVGPA